MTTIIDAKESIYQRFVDNFTGIPLSRISFDNEEFEGDGSDPWTRLTVRSLSRSQNTLGATGNRKFRPEAVVFIQIYTEANTGIKDGDTLAKEAADIFDAVSFDGLDFIGAFIHEGGVDGKWYQTITEINFDYEEIK